MVFETVAAGIGDGVELMVRKTMAEMTTRGG